MPKRDRFSRLGTKLLSQVRPSTPPVQESSRSNDDANSTWNVSSSNPTADPTLTSAIASTATPASNLNVDPTANAATANLTAPTTSPGVDLTPTTAVASAVTPATVVPNPTTSTSGGVAPFVDSSHGASLWEVAFKKLSKDDQALYSSANIDRRLCLEKILEETKKKRDVCRQNKWTFVLRGKVIVIRDLAEKIINWLDKFKEIGSMIVQFDPVHAALPWAGVLFLLQIAVGDKETMGEIFVGIEKITPLLVRCTAYEQLYLGRVPKVTNHEILEETLTTLYATVLEFLAGAKRYFAKSLAAGMLSSLLDASGKKTLLEAIEISETSLGKETAISHEQCRRHDHSKLMEKLEELDKPIKRIDDTVSSMYQLLEEKERLEILKWISSIAYDDHHMNAKSGLLKNTGEWLLKNEAFRDWRSSSSSGIFWLHGIPGAGKTKLTCMVIEKLMSEQQQEPVAFFYCDRNEDPRRKATAVLQVLLKQLSIRFSGSMLPRPVLEAYKKKESKANASKEFASDECQDLIRSLFAIHPQITILIDGLDEMSVTDREEVLAFLKDVVQFQPSLVKVFISSRDSQDIKEEMEDAPNLYIRPIDNLPDIRRFVDREVEEFVKKKRKILENPDGMRYEMVSALMSKADGMFQWVNLQMTHLKRMKLESDIRESLLKLPDTLEEAYKQIYNDILSQSGKEPELSKMSLRWIMISARPLTPAEWVCATKYAMPRVGSLRLPSLLDICHNLVVEDQDSEVVRFAHLSVSEYLASKPEFDNSKAHSLAAHVCLSVLYDTTQATTGTNSDDLLEYATIYWFYHLNHSDHRYMRDSTLAHIRTFLGTPESPTEAYCKWMERAAVLGNSHSFDDGKESLRDVSENLDCWPPNPLFAFAYFYFGGLYAEAWDWSTIDVNCTNANGEPAIIVASFKGHDVIVRTLLDNGADVNSPGFQFIPNPLFAAIRGKKVETVELLLDREADIRANGCRFTDVLTAAVAEGDVAVVKVVLQQDPSMSITSETLLEAVGNDIHSIEITRLLFDNYGFEALEVTQELVAEATRQKRGRELLQLLFAKDPGFPVTEVTVIGVLKHACETEPLKYLLDLYRGDLTEGIMVAAASTLQNRLPLLLARYPKPPITDKILRAYMNHENHDTLFDNFPDVQLTESLFVTLCKSCRLDTRLLQRGLDRTQALEITEKVLIAVTSSGRDATECTKLLLDKNPDIAVSEAILTSAVSNFKCATELWELLLARDSYIKVTRLVLLSALSADWDNPEFMEMLLDRDPSNEIDEEMVLGAVKSNNVNKVRLLFARNPGFKVTPTVLLEAARAPIARILEFFLEKDDTFEIPDSVFEAAMSNWNCGEEILGILLSRVPKVRISSNLLAVAVRGGSVGIMKVLLAGNVSLCAVGSEEVLLAAVGNPNAAPVLLQMILHKVDDASANGMADTKGTKEGNVSSIEITENIVVSAVKNENHAKDLVQLVLAKFPKLEITANIFKAASENKRYGKDVMDLLIRDARYKFTDNASELAKLYLNGSWEFTSHESEEWSAERRTQTFEQLLRKMVGILQRKNERQMYIPIERPMQSETRGATGGGTRG